MTPLLILVSLVVQSAAFTVCPIITGQGYVCEDHIAQTDDGWSLSVQRIPKGNTGLTGKGVVLYQHGLTDCSAGAVMNYPWESLPYILADAGYDVWLGNNRGDGQSMTNAHWKPEDAEFWDFSYDEMALYDLPAHINYVLNVTKARQLSYIGHSEGTTQAFAGFQNASLAAKVNVFIAMAPVTYVSHAKAEGFQTAAQMGFDELIAALGFHEFAVPDFIQQFMPGLCTLEEKMCADGLEAMMGPSTHTNYSRLGYYLNYFPSPTSVKNIAHWCQGIRQNVWQMYDYGNATANVAHYGQPTPPKYDLKAIPTSLPIALFTGGNDYLADPEDLKQLRAGLAVPPYEFNVADYNHVDFIIGQDAQNLLYPAILQQLAKYNTQ